MALKALMQAPAVLESLENRLHTFIYFLALHSVFCLFKYIEHVHSNQHDTLCCISYRKNFSFICYLRIITVKQSYHCTSRGERSKLLIALMSDSA